jgi:hypothetical protein
VLSTSIIDFKIMELASFGLDVSTRGAVVQLLGALLVASGFFTSVASAQAPGTEIEEIVGKLETIQQQLAPLENGTMRLQNVSDEEIEIIWFAVGYWDDSGALQWLDSSYHGYPSFTIRPGGTQELSIVDGQTTIWGGATAVYAMDVKYGSQNYPLSGLWSEVEGRALRINIQP